MVESFPAYRLSHYITDAMVKSKKSPQRAAAVNNYFTYDPFRAAALVALVDIDYWNMELLCNMNTATPHKCIHVVICI